MAKKAAYQAGSEPSHLMCFLYLTCLPMEFGKRAEAKAFKVQMYNFLGQRQHMPFRLVGTAPSLLRQGRAASVSSHSF
ncbi:hypothetical protein NBRC3188_1659 [Acetobacter pasteurianus NBRC 3188]|uniref:Uncharacterized protein n=1 Tax=Acetobacter pasteurianus NBRC 3188 TaxID=1226663 RepID=A0A401WUH4_ACEPA|nr:hypothetical protein NBRC3188_1659 [Acetobacter pasteurianus NBRC 3188]